MSVELLTEHQLDFLSLKGDCTGRLSLHLSKYHFVGNHMLRLIFTVYHQMTKAALSKERVNMLFLSTTHFSITFKKKSFSNTI